MKERKWNEAQGADLINLGLLRIFFWYGINTLAYESVLTRDKILRLIDVSIDEVRLVLDALLAIAQQSDVHYLWRPNLLDEGDNFVLESAIASSALIVTKNIRDFHGGELRFPDLIVLTPQQFCDIYL